MVAGFDCVPNPSTHIRTTKLKNNLTKIDPNDQIFIKKDPQELFGDRFWVAGHLIVIIYAIPSIFFCLTWQTNKLIPKLFYKSTFLAAALVHGAYVNNALDGTIANLYSVLPMRMFQRFVLAVLWLVTPAYTVKIIPYLIFGLFYLTHEKNVDLYNMKPLAPIAAKVHKYLQHYAVETVSYLDLILFLQLLFNMLTFRSRSLISMAVFFFIFRIRLMFSPTAYNVLVNVGNRVDVYLSKPTTPEKLRNAWNMVKIRFKATDLANSQLHNEVTDEAIERANLFNSLDK